MYTRNYALLVFLFVISTKIADAQTGFATHNLPTGYNSVQLRFKNCIATDASNNVYIGFRRIGVGKYTPSTQSWTMYDTTNSGIPSNDVRAIEFDATGNMWIGTYANGLAKFDGSNWTTYTAISNGLVSDTIVCLKATTSGIWCGTRNGLSFFNGSIFTNYTTSNSPLLSNYISCMDIDSSNAILIGNGSLFKFDGSNWTNYTTTTTGQPVNGIFQIKYISSNSTWLLTGLGLYKLSNGNIHYDARPCNRATLNPYYAANIAIEKKNDNKIYSCGTYNSLFRIDQSNNIEYLTDSLSGTIYGSPLQLYMAFDTNGILWFTNDNVNSPQNFHSFDENISAGFVNAINTDYSWQRYLDINNVSALISNRGSMFWNMVGGGGSEPRYEVPKCSGKNSNFLSSFWIGGFDQTGSLHVSAQTYSQAGYHDFIPGPLDTVTGLWDSLSSLAYNNIWKIDRNTVDDFKTNFLNGNVTNGTYPVPLELLSYPAIGSGNYTRNMSPYIDYNNDGNYDPYDGDCPLIKGDQQLYWIFNDTDTSKRESGGVPLNVEIRGYAYSYSCGQYPIGDSNAVLDYTTFYRYEITNRSSNTYDSVYVGLFNDFDLGDAADDYLGCDTVLNTAFCYNGDNYDGTPYGYFTNPPMYNCQILQGPEPVLNDGIDNDHDGTIDETGEMNMMSSFRSLWDDFTGIGFPDNAIEHYYTLTARYEDGSHITYGNQGYGGTVPINYIYPSTPYSGLGWSEMTALNPSHDVRGIISSGPFHLASGETKSIDFAYVFTWDSTAANGLTTSIARNTADLQRVKYWFDNNNYPSCLNTSVQNIEVKNKDVTIFPNPADDYLNVVYSGISKARLEIYDITGRFIIAKEIKNRDKINIRSLSPGLYVAKVKIGDVVVSKKFIKR